MIRYRKLTSSFDTEAYGRIVKQSAQAASRAMERRSLLDPPPEWSEVPMSQDGPITGIFSAPRKVEATEHTGTLPEVLALIRAGELQKGDLIDVGRGWQTLGECFETSEQFELSEGGRSLRFLAIPLALIGIVVLVLWVLRGASS